MWLGVPLAAGLGAAGWSPAAVLAAALEAPRLPRLPVLGVAAALCGVAAGGWCVAGARSGRALGAALAGAVAAGALAVAATRFLPVYLAGPGALLMNGSSIGGSVVRVERLWPDRPDRLHILLGAGRVSRGDVLHLHGGQPVHFLQVAASDTGASCSVVANATTLAHQGRRGGVHPITASVESGPTTAPASAR